MAEAAPAEAPAAAPRPRRSGTTAVVAASLVALVGLVFLGVYGIYAGAATTADQACLSALQVEASASPVLLAEATRIREADCEVFTPGDILGAEGMVVGVGVATGMAIAGWQRFQAWRADRRERTRPNTPG